MMQTIPTGAAARLLGTTEPRLAETVRRGRVQPEPIVVAGRRLWQRGHLIQAARALGVLDSGLLARIDSELGLEADHAPVDSESEVAQ